MQMPKFIRRWQRKRDWHAYGQANKSIREVERTREQYRGCCPDYVEYLDKELDQLLAKRGRLYVKLATDPEV